MVGVIAFVLVFRQSAPSRNLVIIIRMRVVGALGTVYPRMKSDFKHLRADTSIALILKSAMVVSAWILRKVPDR